MFARDSDYLWLFGLFQEELEEIIWHVIIFRQITGTFIKIDFIAEEK